MMDLAMQARRDCHGREAADRGRWHMQEVAQGREVLLPATRTWRRLDDLREVDSEQQAQAALLVR